MGLGNCFDVCVCVCRLVLGVCFCVCVYFCCCCSCEVIKMGKISVWHPLFVLFLTVQKRPRQVWEGHCASRGNQEGQAQCRTSAFHLFLHISQCMPRVSGAVFADKQNYKATNKADEHMEGNICIYFSEQKTMLFPGSCSCDIGAAYVTRPWFEFFASFIFRDLCKDVSMPEIMFNFSQLSGQIVWF